MIDSPVESPAVMTLSSVAAEKLRKDIRGGRYSIGQKLANEHVLADTFGVNRGTIRKALKILEEERLISRRQGHGTFVTNPSYAQTEGTKVSLIGALTWDKEYYFGDILNGAFSRSVSRGYILSSALNGNADMENRNLEAFVKSGIKGLILTPKNHSLDTYKKLIEMNVPVVMLDSILPDIDEDFVSVNDRQGMSLVTQHLIKLGHTRLGYVGSSNQNDIPCVPDRLQGFLSTCARHNLDIRKDWCVAADSNVPDDYLPKMRKLLEQVDRPTAIVAFGDIWAVRVIHVAKEFGLRVPNDLSVTGFDNSEISRTNEVPLTTVSVEPDDLGQAVADLLIEKIEHPQARPKRSILVTPRLIVRKSTTHPL